MKKDVLINMAKKYWPLLGVALIFLVALRLGDNTYGPLVYWILGFFIAFALFMQPKGTEGFKDIAANLPYFIALAVLLLFASFNSAVIADNYANVLICLLLFVGLISFYLLGFSLRGVKEIKPKYVYYAVMGGVALLVFIGLIANLASYPFMYQTLNKGYIYFYEGIRHNISNESQFFYNMSITAVVSDYALGPAMILASSGGVLFFLKYKKENIAEIVINCLFAFLGWFFILAMGKFTVLSLGIPCLFILIGALHKFIKVSKEPSGLLTIIYWAVIALGILGLAAIFINAVVRPAFISNNAILNKIFNNSFLMPINETIYVTCTRGISVLFGTNVLSNQSVSYNGDYITISQIGNSSFEFELLLEGGVVAFLALLVFLVLMIPNLRRYFAEEDIKFEKYGLASIVFTIFVYYSFNYVSLPTHVANHMPSYYAYVSNGSYVILLVLFLLGYTYNSKLDPLEVEESDEVTIGEASSEKTFKGEDIIL